MRPTPNVFAELENLSSGFPIYNLSLAIRTKLFDAKNHLARNAGVLLGWIALSMLTITLFTWMTRREEVRKHEGQADPEPLKHAT